MLDDSAAMDINTELRLAFRLTAQEANLMTLLMSLKYVSPELINERLDVRTVLRVAMHRLRREVGKRSIVIESKRSFGYWLTEDMKARVKQILAEETRQ